MKINIHHPTDSSLLADGVRALGRFARKAKAIVDERVLSGTPDDRFRDRSRSANRLKQRIDRIVRRLRSDAAPGAHREAYGKLLKVSRASMKQAEH